MSNYFNSATGGTFSPNYTGVGTNPRSFQTPLNTAYGAAGLEPFRVHAADFIPYGDSTIPHPDKIARDLIFSATVECSTDADYDEALNEALELFTRATAWEELKKTLTNSAFMGKSTQQLFMSNYPTYKKDLAPAVVETLEALVEAATNLREVNNPFDNDEVINSMADVVSVHALIRGLSRLGALSAIYTIGASGRSRFVPQPLAELLMYVNLDTPEAPLWTDRDGAYIPNTEYDPVVQSVRDIHTALEHTADVQNSVITRTQSERWEYLDTDLMLFYIARGDLEGLSLEYTDDEQELKRRSAALTAATTPVAMTPDQYYKEHPELVRPRRLPQDLVLNPLPNNPATRSFSRVN